MYEKSQKTPLETSAFYGIEAEKSNKISELAEGFLEYARYELNFSPETIIKYRDSLKCLVKDIGDKPVEELEVDDFV